MAREDTIAFLNSIGCQAQAADLASIRFADRIIQALTAGPDNIAVEMVRRDLEDIYRECSLSEADLENIRQLLAEHDRLKAALAFKV